MKNGGELGELADPGAAGLRVDQELAARSRRDRHAAAREDARASRPVRPSTVERVRVYVVPGIPSPSFLVEAVSAGLRMLDFHQMAAFTAENLVLINPVRISGLEQRASAILFHELVHVHQ